MKTPFTIGNQVTILLSLMALGVSPLSAAIYNFTDTAGAGGSSSIDSATITTTNYTNYTSGSPTGSATSSVIFGNSQAGLGNLLPGISTGSGNFTTVYRLSDNNDSDAVERGFNSSVGYDPTNSSQNSPNARYDQISGVGGPIIRPENVTVVTIGGALYFEFMLDGSDGDNAISLDQLMIFTASANVTFPSGVESSNPNPDAVDLMNYFNTSTTANLVYSLDEFNSSGTTTTDNTLLIEFFDSGNGKPDFAFYVPVATILNTVSADTGRIYFWTEMGGAGVLNSINFGASGSFEEWAYYKGPGTTPYSSVVPEPQVYVSGFLLLGLGGFLWWRRRIGPDRSLMDV